MGPARLATAHFLRSHVRDGDRRVDDERTTKNTAPMDGRMGVGCVPRMGSARIWLASSLTVLVRAMDGGGAQIGRLIS